MHFYISTCVILPAKTKLAYKNFLIFYTADIVPPKNDFQFNFPEFSGLPLKIVVSQGGEKTIFTAESFSALSENDEGFFSTDIPENYSVMELEELLLLKNAFENY